MEAKELFSVGIDIGTTTTQVIFSRLSLVNRAAVSQVPRYEFVRREIIWQSPVLFTPVDFAGQLREDELFSLIQAQYQAANIAPESVDSGAVIITGETAKTCNARPAIMTLAQKLGDFVVATAGPHLESMIAGLGSGAQALSQQKMARVLNIDIGGGTANYALFDAGRLIASACLNVGGRLLETDPQGNVLRAHPPGVRIVDSLFGENTDIQHLTATQLQQIAMRMSQLLWEVVTGQLTPLAQQLLMTEPLPNCDELNCDELYAVTLSGGVGECYREASEHDLFRFHDLGPLLAQAIHRDNDFAKLPLQMPKQTVRATVIGAGAHTLSLSGSTIWLDALSLPLRNIPVVHPDTEATESLAEAWQQALTQMDLHAEQDLYALALPDALPVNYAAVQTCITALQNFAARYPSSHPLLIVAGQDFGKALGMLLHPLMGERPLAVIDEVITRTGDYIDIGTPLFNGTVVPVTIKSLAFPS
ncbi:ethanolamine ammonia-lyase reactivating factor EutA [Photorhabdus laumondii subsp. laumondii]|uniref:Ethanolamine utilization protein n=2 Tax=Photorhabdus laumondii subsp. laumondii TaxID=141679 RepID=Q7N2V5_PHOLL|nr:ethanolamine ammonia-lyase reactivating factor EutA [Photorhabdus laumondii]AXG47996.1 ethanolamine ammonia-lyase reactivating factor EutA [Photorhabdus laumondii subsp. laumondii]KTL63260.1 reactivating factor for ethanolamine ammonia lyase [Photorhabdus laumondii subsp. laumondii]MCC8384775.1 ethanolamine ammonia-lyase reactivating factor EutA [Photorhabdus laumondii]MCC8415128.1 ethanolamine ammonia-lyase reactivating factor EutA [Photorhabdus laumondii]NDK94964.1 ethanolamine ammonia-ly